MDFLFVPEMDLLQNPQQFEVLGLYIVVIYLFISYIIYVIYFPKTKHSCYETTGVAR